MSSITFLGGLLLGLGGSLHCAGMCGGIASSLVLGFAGPATLRSRSEILAASHVGKTAAYVTAGAVLGAAGAGVYGLFDREAAYFILQRVGAAGVGWVGLSLLGLAPPLRVMDRVLAPLRTALLRQARTGRNLTAGLAGLCWGLMPCGMVYSALLYAMLAGSAMGGAMVMLGFGLGVAPAVFATALGVSWLPGLARQAGVQRWIGVALLGVAAATLLWPAGAVSGLCISGL